MSERLDRIEKIIEETAKMSRKNKAEFDKYKKETKGELDKLKKETEIARKEKESEFKRIGMFWGDDAEATFEQATKNGLVVEGREFIQNTTNYKIYDDDEQEAAEIDILMSNGKYILLIETKHNLPKYKKELKRIEALDAEFDRKIAVQKNTINFIWIGDICFW